MGAKGSKQSKSTTGPTESKHEEAAAVPVQQPMEKQTETQPAAENDDFVEAVVAKTSDVPDGR